MLNAAFSRKKSHKHKVSSEIEDDGQSMSRYAAQVEDDEDNPHSRRVNGVKKDKRPNVVARKERIPDDEDEDDGGDDEERIDVENFRDQPLGRTEVTKLQGLSRDWKMVADQVKPNWSVVGDVAVALADYGEGKEVEYVCGLFVLLKICSFYEIGSCRT